MIIMLASINIPHGFYIWELESKSFLNPSKVDWWIIISDKIRVENTNLNTVWWSIDPT